MLRQESFSFGVLLHKDIQLCVASKVKVMLPSGAWMDSNNSLSSSQILIPA